MVLKSGMLVVVTHKEHEDMLIQGRLKPSRFRMGSFVVKGTNYAIYPDTDSYEKLTIEVLE